VQQTVERFRKTQPNSSRKLQTFIREKYSFPVFYSVVFVLLAYNNLLRLFIGHSNGLETAALPLSPLAANLLLTVVLLIVFSRMAFIDD
jgi:hypothetical protein